MFTKNNMQLDSIAEAVKKVMAKEAEVDESGLRMAAHAAHRQGQKMFTFKGKTYPVKVQGEDVTYGECMEEVYESVKIATKTGTRVLGHSYGNSAAAHRDQTKHSVDDVKEPTKKDIEKDSKLYQKTYHGTSKNYLRPDTQKYFSKTGESYKNEEVEIDEEGDCVTKPEVKDIAKKEVKGHEKKMHHKEGYDFASRLINSLSEEAQVEKELNEVLGKDAKAADWIHDFIHSDNPKFAGKSKAKRQKMALAAYYAKKNESFDDEHGTGEKHDDEKEDKALVKKMVKKDALKKEEVELDEAKVTTPDENPNRITTDMLSGREEGGKSNSFKSFKLKLKSDGEMKAPGHDEPEETTSRKSIKAKDGLGDQIDNLDSRYGKPNSFKEEVELNEDNLDSIAKKHGMDFKRTTYGAGMTHKTKGEISINRYGEWHHYPAGSKSSKAHGDSGNNFSSLDKHLSTLKEEVELDEETPKKNQDIADKSYLKHKPGTVKGDLKQLGRFLRGKPEIKEAKTLSPGQDDAPFEKPYTTAPKNVKDKSGAVHTPMSRAKDSARSAMKRLKTEMLGKAPGNN